LKLIQILLIACSHNHVKGVMPENSSCSMAGPEFQFQVKSVESDQKGPGGRIIVANTVIDNGLMANISV